MKLKEMPYPQGFDLQVLEKLPSYAARIRYLNAHLKKIASGSSRIVYLVDNEKVLKVAKNKKGLAQNETEADRSIQRWSSVFAQIFDASEDSIFLEMELARKPTPTDFKRIVGISLEELNYYLVYAQQVRGDPRRGSRYYQNSLSKERIQQISENEWVQDLEDVALSYDFALPGDFGRISTYGKVKRDGQDAIVVIDFGLTWSTYDTHYARKRQ